jgi:hypothetical protein
MPEVDLAGVDLKVVLRSGFCREAGSGFVESIRTETEEPPTMSASHPTTASAGDLRLVPGLAPVDFGAAPLPAALAEKVEGELEVFAAHMRHGLLSGPSTSAWMS